MAPKFIVDINLPDLTAEEQMAACQRFLEEKLEDFSSTPLTVEPVEGDDNVGMDTKQVAKVNPPAKAAPAAKPSTGKNKVTSLYALLSTTKEGHEGICTLKGQPLVFGFPENYEKAKKAFSAQLQVDPAPEGMKFRGVRFQLAQELGVVK